MVVSGAWRAYLFAAAGERLTRRGARPPPRVCPLCLRLAAPPARRAGGCFRCPTGRLCSGLLGACAGQLHFRNGICWQPRRYARPAARPRYCVLDELGRDEDHQVRFLAGLDEAFAEGRLEKFLAVTRRRFGGAVKLNGIKPSKRRAAKVGAQLEIEAGVGEGEEMVLASGPMRNASGSVGSTDDASQHSYHSFRAPPAMKLADWLCLTQAERARPFDSLRTVWYAQHHAGPSAAKRPRDYGAKAWDADCLKVAFPPHSTPAAEKRRRRPLQDAFSCRKPLLDSLVAHWEQWLSHAGGVDLILACGDEPHSGDAAFKRHTLRAIQVALSTGLFRRVWLSMHDEASALFETMPQALSWHYVAGRERALYEAIRGAALERKTRTALAAWGARPNGGPTSESADAIALDRFVATGAGGADVKRESYDPYAYFGELAKYRFLVAPFGKAVLSPKFAEALLVMTIPITKRYAAFEDLVAYGWPMVLVDDWEEITADKLEQWWADLSPRLPLARWVATNRGLESLIHGDCYDGRPPPNQRAVAVNPALKSYRFPDGTDSYVGPCNMFFNQTLQSRVGVVEG